MSCCNNCGCNSSPCKNLSISDIAPLDYVQGVDANGCPKFQSVTTLIPVVHPPATLTNNAAPFTWNAATQTGNIPQVGKLVANADGSYTFTAGDGSAPVVIPKECCPTMAMVGNTVTFTNGDGSVITFTLHPAATFAQAASPFSWNTATQVGNMPQSPRLVANADGSYTFTAGDGSTPVVIPKDCCPTMTLAGNVVTFTNGDGSVVTFTLHPAATLTNNAAPFTWNAATQTGNIPQSPSLALTPTGFLFTPGNGAAATVYTEPADTFISGFTIVGNVATITRNDGVTFTQTVPTSIDINVQSFQLSGSNLVLTETDGTVHTVPLPAEVKVNAVSYVPGTGVITITNSDGTSVSTTIDTCAALNALPTGTPGVAGTTLFLGKDCEWHALPVAAAVTNTPLVANDSATVDFTTSGTDNHTVTAAVKVSASAGNAMVTNADGLYVANDTPLNANDSSTINFATSGTDNHTVTAAVKVSASTCNGISINADGLWTQLDNGSYVRVVTNLPNVTRVDADLAAIPIQTPTEIDNVTMTFNNPQCYPVVVYGMYRSGNIYMQAGPGNSWETQIGPTTNPAECASRWGVSAGEPAEDFGISSIRFPYILDVPAGGSASITFTRRLNIIEYTPNAINRIIWGVGNSYHIVTR